MPGARPSLLIKYTNFAQNTTQPNNYYPNAAADINLFDGDLYTLNAIKGAYQWRVFDRATNTYIAVESARYG